MTCKEYIVSSICSTTVLIIRDIQLYTHKYFTIIAMRHEGNKAITDWDLLHVMYTYTS